MTGRRQGYEKLTDTEKKIQKESFGLMCFLKKITISLTFWCQIGTLRITKLF